jgi:hypothetical protein
VGESVERKHVFRSDFHHLTAARRDTVEDDDMYRVVFFTIGVLILLLIDVASVYVAATSGSVLLSLLLAIPGMGLILSLVAVRFDPRGRPSRKWPHRGATRVGYNPWIGGGIDEDR